MDVSFNNVLEGTRQYFMGLPKQAQADGSGQPLWQTGAPLPEEGAPAQSGAPAPSSRPPSAAAAPPSVPSSTPIAAPPRPPSEPIEPEPHIIHKATVMREAAEKRREQPEIEDDEEAVGTLSPPSHIIRKPPRTLPSPAPAPAAPCPSPARPPSAAPLQPPAAPEPQLEPPAQYRPPVHRVQTPTARQPDHYAPGRPPDPYPTSRPPESYGRYHYESKLSDGNRNTHGPVASPQPSTHSRHSPQTYARLSGSMPQHTASRLRDVAAQSPPTHRYQMQPAQPPPPPNDRVPPIHHPPPAPPVQRHATESRSPQLQYSSINQRREPSPYGRTSSHYDRHPVVPQRKYDPQQAYPSYRPSPIAQPVQSHRVDTHHQIQYKHAAMEVMSAHYSPRTQERSPVPIPPHPHDAARFPPRADYPNMSRSVDTRSGYHYSTASTSTSRYGPSVPVPLVQNSTQSRPVYRPATAPKTSYEYTPSTPVQTSPARSTVKPGYPNQARMTVSVTSLVNQMNQTKQKQESPAAVPQVSQSKQKRESPLDLSVKTVKNSADSSTTQDDAIDSAVDSKMMPLPHRPSSSTSRHAHLPTTSYVGSHKVDFAPNFTQYGERSTAHGYGTLSQPGHHALRYNGTYETHRPVAEQYPIESPHRYPERSIPVRTDYVPKIDLTRSVGDQRHPDNRVRDDRHFIIEERKRPAGPIVSNIPEKIVRYETWTADSRIDHLNQSAREQHELMKQPVYSYSRYKQLEAYQNEQKRPAISGVYREHHSHTNRRYASNPYHPELLARESSEYHAHYHDRNPSVNNRHHVIQKIPSHRDINSHHFDPSSGIPADKRVLSILRNSLETKQTGFVEPPRQAKHIPDLIVIDDAEDSVIDITDLTKENDAELASKNITKPLNHITPNLNQHIQMPRAVDSLPRDSDYNSPDSKSKSPENDVASRIRTKAELKVMPPSQDSVAKVETKQTPPENEKLKLLPRKTHLFNQIREDNLRLESVIKNEEPPETIITEVKTEPMNIEEIEKDAVISIKTENILESLEPEGLNQVYDAPVEDLDWASACDSFMEQLKTGCHKKKTQRRRIDTSENDSESKVDKFLSTDSVESSSQKTVVETILPTEEIIATAVEIISPALEIIPLSVDITPPAVKITPPTDEITRPADEITPPAVEITPPVTIKQEPMDEDDINNDTELPLSTLLETIPTSKLSNKSEKCKNDKKSNKEKESERRTKIKMKTKIKTEKSDNSDTSCSTLSSKKETKEKTPIKTVIKEECESTDDDEPLIKSKILKEKEQSDRLKYQLLKDLSEKSAYVKLECCDVDVNKNTRKSLDSTTKEKEEKHGKGKLSRQMSRSKGKLSIENNKHIINSSSDSDDDDLSVARRLRVRKNTKTEDTKITAAQKTPVKSPPMKKQDSSSASNSSTPVRKPTFGDSSCFHPGWEEELFKYKRSLRMPTRLIAIPRGRSGGPFVRGTGAIFTRGSTSLPDLDPAPLSPAPSSVLSAATDDLYARRPDKLTIDSDLDSNSSYSTPNKLHYDSEASTSTVLSSKIKKKSSSIVDVLIQKCGRKEDSKRDKKSKDKEDKTPKVIPKKSSNELLPTPSLGLVKNGNKGSYNVKKEKLMEDIFYLGAFRKETVTAFRNSFIKDTDGLIGATEEFAPVVLKSRTRTESRVLKQRATIKEVFGDERPASAPPSSCRDEDLPEEKTEKVVEIKKEPETKPKFKPRKIVKDKLKRRSSSIRDGLRSTKSLKRNDAKGRLMRLKKRNSIMKSLNHKRTKEMSANKHKSENLPAEEKDKTKVESSPLPPAEGVNTKRRLKRLFGRRKFSSGFDYIRKKKKIIRREEPASKIRRPAAKPSPESVHDIHKEIKGWFINKSIGETHLHRAARLGYTVSILYS